MDTRVDKAGYREYAVRGQRGTVHWVRAELLNAVEVYRYDNLHEMKENAPSTPLHKKQSKSRKVLGVAPAPNRSAVTKKVKPACKEHTNKSQTQTI